MPSIYDCQSHDLTKDIIEILPRFFFTSIKYLFEIRVWKRATNYYIQEENLNIIVFSNIICGKRTSLLCRNKFLIFQIFTIEFKRNYQLPWLMGKKIIKQWQAVFCWTLESVPFKRSSWWKILIIRCVFLTVWKILFNKQKQHSIYGNTLFLGIS